MPLYVVRHLNAQSEELPCLLQLEDEYAAMYFNIVHGRRLGRRFTTEKCGDASADYRLVATEFDERGFAAAEREIELYELTEAPGRKAREAPARTMAAESGVRRDAGRHAMG